MIVTARGPGVWFRRLLRKLELKAEEDDRGAGRLAAPEQAVAGVPAARITILALRYVAGRMALARLEAVFRLKYLLLPGAVGLALFTDHPVGPVLLAVLFVTCVALQWMAGRAVVRLLGLREMAALDDVWAGVRSECWTNVKRELRRVGLSPRPAALVRLSAAYFTGRPSNDQTRALEQFAWTAVLPRAQWSELQAMLLPTAGSDDRVDAGADGGDVVL